MKYFILFLFGSLLCTASAQNQQTGLFQYHTDIGNPRNQGYSLYDPTDRYYTLRGSGYNIWFERDEFYFLYNELKGDFILTPNFKFKGEGSAPHRKTGWMLRASVSDDSPHISAVLHGDGLTVMISLQGLSYVRIIAILLKKR